MVTVATWRRGLLAGARTTWTLGKVIFPVTVAVTVLRHTPVIDGVTALLAPLMTLVGLPGEAAVALALGNLLNLYAAIGAMLSMTLTVKEVFLLAVMLSFSHNLLVETAVTTRIGVSVWAAAGMRLGLAFGAAALLNLLWRGGEEPARYGLVPPAAPDLAGDWAAVAWHGIETAFWGVVQMALIVVPLMVVIELLKDLRVVDRLARALAPVTRLLGLSERTSLTLLAGLLFGLAFGAGVIIESAREAGFSKRDLYLLTLFLSACHAVVEDTLIFVPLGINVVWLLILRLAVAFILTILLARVWRALEARRGRSENPTPHQA